MFFNDGFVSFRTDHFSVYAVTELSYDIQNVSVQPTAGGLIVKADLSGASEDVISVYSAAYDEHGKMLGISSGTQNGTKTQFNIALSPTSNPAGVRIFLLERTGYTPLCHIEISAR